jgi:hydroxyethylthiazole kinase
MRTPEGEFVHFAADILERLRARRPRVHCITNAVAQGFTANLLLAAGAVPSMTISPEEVASFVAGSDALLVNLGTLESARRAAIGIAVDAATEKGVPWILDPVFIDRSETRAVFTQALIRLRPSAVHLNGDEFAALAAAEATTDALTHYARETGAVLALTGETDIVTDGTHMVRIANGHPWMANITAMGCAGAAVTAACLAVEAEPWLAVAAGQLIVGVAGEIAAEHARGPGSLAVGILDALNGLRYADLVKGAKVK